MIKSLNNFTCKKNKLEAWKEKSWACENGITLRPAWDTYREELPWAGDWSMISGQ